MVPALIGLFWGAPLVARELETGTFRLAWTQSVTRTRWLAVSSAVVGPGLGGRGRAAQPDGDVVVEPDRPVDRGARLSAMFDQRDIVPVGYAAFAFALGVTAGVLIRRTLPAMAATLVVFVAVRLAVPSSGSDRTSYRPSTSCRPSRHWQPDRDSTEPVGPPWWSATRPACPTRGSFSTDFVSRSGQTSDGPVPASACPDLLQRPAGRWPVRQAALRPAFQTARPKSAPRSTKW